MQIPEPMKAMTRELLRSAYPHMPRRGRDRLVGLLQRHLMPKDGFAKGIVFGSELEFNLHDYVESWMYYGQYEIPERNELCRQIQIGDVVMDVGSHIGYLASLFSKIVGPSGQVHAFEPVPATFIRLERHVSNNRMSNVVSNCMAVGAKVGTLEIYEGGNCNPALASIVSTRSEHHIAVPVTTIDEYVASRRIGKVDFIKMDIEGGEYFALQGAIRLLSSEGRPRGIFLEIDNELLDSVGVREKDIFHLLHGLRYESYYIGGRQANNINNVMFVLQ